MAKTAQRARIEAVAGNILGCMTADKAFNRESASAVNADSGSGWPAELLGIDQARIPEWELDQAYLLAFQAFAHGARIGAHLTWTDPRKTGRPRVYDEPLQGIFLELPSDLLDTIEAARGETTRREWIETAIRQRLGER